MKIDFAEVEKGLWALYYDEFPNGKLNQMEARLIYDCMVIVNYLKKTDQQITIADFSCRP